MIGRRASQGSGRRRRINAGSARYRIRVQRRHVHAVSSVGQEEKRGWRIGDRRRGSATAAAVGEGSELEKKRGQTYHPEGVPAARVNTQTRRVCVRWWWLMKKTDVPKRKSVLSVLQRAQTQGAPWYPTQTAPPVLATRSATQASAMLPRSRETKKHSEPNLQIYEVKLATRTYSTRWGQTFTRRVLRLATGVLAQSVNLETPALERERIYRKEEDERHTGKSCDWISREVSAGVFTSGNTTPDLRAAGSAVPCSRCGTMRGRRQMGIRSDAYATRRTRMRRKNGGGDVACGRAAVGAAAAEPAASRMGKAHALALAQEYLPSRRD
ncbi:hypothetical protein DFH06DRAFT_1152791 [Mycena polygramma]|nr:hypothetical protein DFH06DRAFT_1152791 [Mycena polygramma]